jgi:hypothetical protein
MIAGTREFWERRAGRRFHDEDAREIAENMVGFFDLLHKWDLEQRAAIAGSEKGDRDESRN